MNKDLFKSGMRSLGATGNGMAKAGGGTPTFDPDGLSGDSGDESQPGLLGGGLSGILKRFKSPSLQAPIPAPIGATDPGSMVQRPRGMMSSL